MRMRHALLIAFCCINLLASSISMAQNAPQMWDRSSAMATLQSVDINAAVSKIGNAATLSNGAETLYQIDSLNTRFEWPLPVREAVLYRFAKSLSALPRDAVAVEIMQYLFTYQAQALVPHEDHGDAYEPLFNIRSAVQGVENNWLRLEAAEFAQILLTSNPEHFVSAYQRAFNFNTRAGYLDALRITEPGPLLIVQNLLIPQLSDAPELTAILGVTVARSGYVEAANQLLLYGKGAPLAQSLRELGERLPDDTLSLLLANAITSAPPANAALAIAQWWPHLQHDAYIRDLLLETLSNPALGSTAALALSNKPDIQTIRVLQTTANGNTIAARRAQTALDINRANLNTELQK